MNMSRLLATAVAGLMLASAVAREATAQQPGRPVGAIAILDLEYIFKHHARLETLKNQMQRDVQGAEQDVQKARSALQDLAKRLEEYKKGSEDFKKLEEELAKRQADITLQVNVQRRNFAEQQSKIFFGIYQQVADEVKTYCQANGIQLVMRFNGDRADPTDPDDIVRQLNKSVVYNAAEIDITPIILARINGSNPTPPVQQPIQQPGGITGPAGPAGPTYTPGPAGRTLPPRR